MVLLRAVLAVAAALALRSTNAAPLSARQQSLATCLQSKGLAPVTQSSADYKADSAAYNQRIQPKPVAILYPSSSADISKALKCASSSGVKVSARGGGHSYASYGLGSGDGGFTIDLSRFSNITVDSNGLATIGGGSRLGDIYLALNDQGWAVAAGSCNGVGIGGHAGFGGYGLPSRMWGFLSDQVVAFDIVLANGTALSNVTSSSHSDLFWTLKGAAPNYGIVTAYHVQAHHAPANVVIAKYMYSNPSVVNAATAFSSLAAFGNLSAPANLALQAVVGRDSLEIVAVWYGPEAELGGVIGSLEDELPPSYEKTATSYSWIGATTELAGVSDLSTKGKMLQNRDSFFAKSLLTPSTVPISIDTLEAFFDYLWTSNTSTNWFVEANVYGGANSAINDVSLDASSFGFRDKHLAFQLYASSPTYGNPYPSEGIPFVKGMWSTIVDGMTKKGWTSNSSSPDGYAAYVNYVTLLVAAVDPTLTAKETRVQYWGSQYPRLAKLKAVYDPNQLINSPQGIRPTSS
ncbi:hypothetical protein JCM8208_007759 [Rhodotorula glutinis]